MRGISARAARSAEGVPHGSWGTLVLWLDEQTAAPVPLLTGLAERQVDWMVARNAYEAVALCAQPTVRGVIVIEPSIHHHVTALRDALDEKRPDLVCWRYVVDHHGRPRLAPFAQSGRDAGVVMSPRGMADAIQGVRMAEDRDATSSVRTARPKAPPHDVDDGRYLSHDELSMLLGDDDAPADTDDGRRAGQFDREGAAR